MLIKLLLKTLQVALARISLAITRFNFAENKLDGITYDVFRLTPVALIRKIK
jgi:hypothetical protein